MASLEDIKPLIEEKLKFLRMDLYDIKFIPAGKRSILRVLIDKDEGVTIADCERASTEIAMILDVEEFSSGAYSLEVSSPGADRVLKTAKDFKRVSGHHITIQLKPEAGSSKGMSVTGKCVSATNDAVTLELDDETEKKIMLADIDKGKIEIRFK